MSLVYQKKYEQRLDGMSDLIGRDLEIRWGGKPKTNGSQILLPDEPIEIWDSEDMVRGAFAHEVAHNMFDTDMRGMYDWRETWSNSGDKFHWEDPYGLVSDVAEHVIGVLEDQRIESLYGEIYEGAARRFDEVIKPRIAETNDPRQDPATTLLVMRCCKGNTFDWAGDTYRETVTACEEMGIDDSVLWDALDRVEGASMDATFLMAEKVMGHILPWYEDRIRHAMTDDLDELSDELEEEREEVEDLEETESDLLDELEDKKRDKRQAEADGDWDESERLDREIDEIEDELDEVEREKRETEKSLRRTEREWEQEERRSEQEKEQIEEIRGDHEDTVEGDIDQPDYDPPDEVFGEGDWDEEDLEEAEEQGRRKLNSLREKMSSSQTEEVDPEDYVDADVHRKPSGGARKAEIYHGIVDDIESEFVSILGRKRERLASTGQRVDVDALIDSEAQDGLDPNIMSQEMLELGFTTMVVLDLSMSMIGPKLNVCRNIGATLYKSFDSMSEWGIPLDFFLVGYGGSTTSNEIMIKECEDLDEVSRITHDPNYPNTPTWQAIQFSRERIRMEEGVKFLILVTDGRPTGREDDSGYVDGPRALTLTRREVKECRRSGIEVFTLGIGTDMNDTDMRQTYQFYENVEDEEEAGRRLLEFVRDKVRRHAELL